MGDMWDVGRKQVEDAFSSKKFIGLLLLFLAFSMGTVYMGAGQYEERMTDYRSGEQWADKPDFIDIFSMMMQLNMPLAAGLLAIFLSYDSISKEREEGTIELLLSYPVYRDEVINGKFVSGIFILALALMFSFIAGIGLAIYMVADLPTMSNIFRLSFVWLGTVIYMGFFLALATFLSTIFRSSWRSLGACFVILILFLATPFLADFGANQLYKMDCESEKLDRGPQVVRTGPGAEEMVVENQVEDSRIDQRRKCREKVQRQREEFQNNVVKLSPSISYRKFTATMLGTNYHEEGYPPTLSENLKSALGYLIFLISQTSLMFTASYAVFMRQDL
jgi:ABC-2 type transport system permease protein